MWIDADKLTSTEIQCVILRAIADYDVAAEAEADAEAAMNEANSTLDQCDRAMHGTDVNAQRKAKSFVAARWNEWYGTPE